MFAKSTFWRVIPQESSSYQRIFGVPKSPQNFEEYSHEKFCRTFEVLQKFRTSLQQALYNVKSSAKTSCKTPKVPQSSGGGDRTYLFGTGYFSSHKRTQDKIAENQPLESIKTGVCVCLCLWSAHKRKFAWCEGLVQILWSWRHVHQDLRKFINCLWQKDPAARPSFRRLKERHASNNFRTPVEEIGRFWARLAQTASESFLLNCSFLCWRNCWGNEETDKQLKNNNSFQSHWRAKNHLRKFQDEHLWIAKTVREHVRAAKAQMLKALLLQ